MPGVVIGGLIFGLSDMFGVVRGSGTPVFASQKGSVSLTREIEDKVLTIIVRARYRGYAAFPLGVRRRLPSAMP